MPLRASILLVFSVVIIFLSNALPDDGENQKVNRQQKYAQSSFPKGDHGRKKIIRKKPKQTERKTKKIKSKMKLQGNSNRAVSEEPPIYRPPSQVKNLITTRGKNDLGSRRKPTNNKCKCGLPNTQRIIGGDKINTPRKYPWLVFVTGHDNICSGSLISSGHVLTAAHCAHNGETWLPNKGWKVHIGDHNLKKTSDNLSEETLIMKAKLIKHRKFNHDSAGYDIALMKLDKQIDLDNFHNIRPICLPKNAKFKYMNKKAICAGWGLTRADAKTIPLSPYEIKLKITNNKCRGYSVSKNMICTDVHWAKKSPYTGDSGGPLMVEKNGKFVQIGVVSHGQTISIIKGSKAVMVYTSVTKLLKWILSNIRGDNTCI